MNFLAHCLLPEVACPGIPAAFIAGGFLGDFVKGGLEGRFPPDLENGIRLHRRIDAFSNRLPGIEQSCARLPANLRRYAPIFLDVVADHVLARHWSDFHNSSLVGFTNRVYTILEAHGDHLPDHGHRFLEHARSQDLFARYAEADVLAGVLTSIARRLGKPELATETVAAVNQTLPGLEEDFREYFPTMVEHTREWLVARGYG